MYIFEFWLDEKFNDQKTTALVPWVCSIRMGKLLSACNPSISSALSSINSQRLRQLRRRAIHGRIASS